MIKQKIQLTHTDLWLVQKVSWHCSLCLPSPEPQKTISSALKERVFRQENSNINFEKWNLPKVIRKKERKNTAAKKLTRQVRGINILHQTHRRRSSQTNRFKELFTIPLLSPCNHPSNGLVQTLNTVKKNYVAARPQQSNLPVHLRANPFLVFCSFKLAFILSPPFISSISCLGPLLPH